MIENWTSGMSEVNGQNKWITETNGSKSDVKIINIIT
jgi:hypothetical protein